jgi:hypothetical protein
MNLSVGSTTVLPTNLSRLSWRFSGDNNAYLIGVCGPFAAAESRTLDGGMCSDQPESETWA